MKTSLPYWIVIFVLFAVSMLAVNERNVWVESAYFWYGTAQEKQYQIEENSNWHTKAMFSLLCKAYPNAHGMTMGEGAQTAGMSEVAFMFYTNEYCTTADIYRDVKIRE